MRHPYRSGSVKRRAWALPYWASDLLGLALLPVLALAIVGIVVWLAR